MSRLKIEKEFDNFLKVLWRWIKFPLLVIFYPKWKIAIILTLAILGIGTNVANYYILDHIKKTYLNIPLLKKSIINFTKSHLERAIVVGVADFSIWNGISFEDVRISAEEDFSSNKLIFFTRKIDFKVDIFGQNPNVFQKITIHNAKININLDNKISEDFWDKLVELPLPDIYFKNLELTLQKDGLDIFTTVRPLNVKIHKIQNDIETTFDDAPGYFPFNAKIYGESSFKKDNKTTMLAIKLKDYELVGIKGIVEKLIYVKPESGVSNGSIKLLKDKNSYEVNGSIDIQKLYGILNFFQEAKVEDVTLKTSFLLKGQNEKKDLPKSLFERKIEGLGLSVLEQIELGEKDLTNYKLSFGIKKVEDLLGHFNLKKFVDIKGNIKLDANITETGDIKDWFQINGYGQLENFNFESFQKPSLKIKLDNLDLNINGGNIYTRFSGKLFEKQFVSGINMKLKYAKFNQEDGKVVYPLNINIVHNMSLDDMVLENYYPIYQKIENYIQDSIKDRQEKMLPESFFIQTDVYKKYLENLEVNSNISTENLRISNNSVNLGKYKTSINTQKDKSLLISISGEDDLLKNKSNSIIAQIQYHNQLPAMSLKVSARSFLWFDETIKICGNTMYTNSIDTNLVWQGYGNNFSSFFDTQSLNGEITMKTNKIKQTDFAKNIHLGKYTNENVFNLFMNFRGYGRKISFSPIQIDGKQVFLRGNGEYELDKLVFSLNGNSGNQNYSFSISEDTENCFLK
ncbi:MAG: hypothetical protein KDK90_23830 [Leptospiraceae bacterium]|nr:hypothetical protein [Leptospiraceae bacterium]